MSYTGELAALIAAAAFSITSTLFTLSGRKFGPGLVMRASLPIALVCLMGLHLLLYGTLVPADAEVSRWFWLGLSGISGFWWSSIALVHAFVRIGPRLTLLIGAIGPILSAILAWLLLNERLDELSILGIVLTISGIVWVVSDRGDNNGIQFEPGQYRAGLLFALWGAVLQGFGFILSKEGVQGDFEPISASLIRLLCASVAIWVYTALRGDIVSSFQRLRAFPVAFRQMIGASVMGPVIGASLVMVSLQLIPVGVSSTLVNLTPIFLIPIGYFVFKERITRRAIVGTIIAIAGIALLFL